MKSVCKAFVIVANEEYELLLMWRMKSVCKAFVIVANEDCVHKLLLLWRMKSVQSFCYCRD